MATKGPSNQYDNTRGGAPHKPTKHINYKYANEFDKSKLNGHYKKHKKEFHVRSKEQYEAKAIEFANKIDHRNCRSVIDRDSTTYKYNIKTREFVMVTKNGIITTYHYKDRFDYVNKEGKRVWVEIN